MVDDGHGGVEVGVEPLLQGLEVVVGTAGAGGAAAEAAVHAGFLVAREEQNKLEVHLREKENPCQGSSLYLAFHDD